jgi:hypothetical protein
MRKSPLCHLPIYLELDHSCLSLLVSEIHFPFRSQSIRAVELANGMSFCMPEVFVDD